MKAFTPCSSFLALLLLLLSWTNTRTEAVTCYGDEEVLEFTFFLDEDALQENGWNLTCDGLGTVWDVPAGTIQNHFRLDDPDSPFVMQQVCIAKDTSCNFILEDTFGDGLIDPGYFYLTYGATTLVVSTEGEEFHEKQSCFGPACTVEPQEIAEQCNDFYLYFQANSQPEQNMVRVECDGEVIFVKSDFQEPQESTEFEKCIPSTKCCNLVVNDGDNDLTTMEGIQLNVEWAGKVIVTQDVSDQDASGSIRQSFGVTCDSSTSSPKVNTSTPPSTVQSTTTTQEAQSMKSSSFKNSGGFIALVVVACLVTMGVLVKLVIRRSPSSPVAQTGKDLEVRSTGSKETDTDDEV